MRVTFDPVADGLRSIDAAQTAMAQAEWQVSSGKRLQAPSDDPSAAQRIVAEHASLASLDTYTRASDSASTRLSSLDTALGDIVNQLSAGMTAAASAQGTTATQTVRDAAVATLTGVRDAIAADINTSFNGVYLFSGSKATSKPFERVSGVWTYRGDANSVSVDIDSGSSVTLATSGQDILQGSDAQNVLTSLDSLIAAVQATTRPRSRPAPTRCSAPSTARRTRRLSSASTRSVSTTASSACRRNKRRRRRGCRRTRTPTSPRR